MVNFHEINQYNNSSFFLKKWHLLESPKDLSDIPWPAVNNKLPTSKEVKIVVQINGKKVPDSCK